MELNYEPSDSHQLVNALANMVDAVATIKYTEWDKCTRREEKIRGERRSRDNKPDERKGSRTNLALSSRSGCRAEQFDVV
eukprot:4950456-Amphidinium_carterae.1